MWEKYGILKNYGISTFFRKIRGIRWGYNQKKSKIHRNIRLTVSQMYVELYKMLYMG